ncbi:unnamed protein product [Ciceribacter sp. T2.26MG-112.2]|nr:unnamed protein product [Ciceribacter naphthalenivorans]
MRAHKIPFIRGRKTPQPRMCTRDGRPDQCVSKTWRRAATALSLPSIKHDCSSQHIKHE